MLNDMSWGLYHASPAQGMPMEPPSAVTAFCNDSVTRVVHWRYDQSRTKALFSSRFFLGFDIVTLLLLFDN